MQLGISCPVPITCLVLSVSLFSLLPKAFSMPVVQVEHSSHGDTLQCEAPRWLPRPAVHWMACGDTGEHLPLAANTSYQLNPENITVKVVSLLNNITANATYTCVIENCIAKAVVNIRVTGRARQHPEITGTGESTSSVPGAPGGSCSSCVRQGRD